MSIFTYIGVALILIAIAGFLYFFVFRKGNPPLPRDEVRINGATFDVEIASSTLEKATGLSFRPGLGENQGMLFLFSSGQILHFWMKDMNFPLDIIWISGDKVMGFAQNAPAEPGVPLWKLTIYNSPDGTDKVLEVNAGTVERDNIKIGDMVEVGTSQ